MEWRRFAVSLGVLVALQSGHAQTVTKAGQADLLQLPLFPVHLVRKDIPVTRGLEEVGIEVRNGYVVFGVELHLKGGKEPLVSLDLPPGSKLGDALRQILRQLPEYGYEVVGQHVVNVYAAKMKNDPRSVLNLRVERFDITNEQPSSVLSQPQLFIPELRQRLTPAMSGSPRPTGTAGVIVRGTEPPVSLHLRNVTLRQILSAISEATEGSPSNYSPLGWVYSFEPNPALPAGGKHSWMWLISVPHNWKEEAEKGRHTLR